MALRLVPRVPVGIKPTPDSFGGPSTVPGNWWQSIGFVMPFWDRSGGSGGDVYTSELISGTAARGEAASSIQWAYAPTGTAIQTDASSVLYMTEGTPGEANTRLTDKALEITVLWVGYSSNNGTFMMSNADDGVYNWGLYRNGSAGIQVFYGATATTVSTFAYTNGVRYAVVATVSAASTNYYIRNLASGEITVESVAGVTLVNQGQIGDFVVGGRETGSNYNFEMDGVTEFAAGWYRAMAPSEVYDLLDDFAAPIRSYSYVGAPDAAATSILPFMMQYAH